MAEVLLSNAEKTFIIHVIQDNIRTDGRKCDDYRHIDLELDLVSNSAGSARLRLANSDILVGIKVEIGEPKLNRPNEGYLEFFVDFSANAAPEFEGRGGEELANVISATLSRAYSHQSCLDLSTLGIIPAQKCWVLYIDILILECGGNLFDAISVAVKAALYNTRIPSLTVTPSEQGQAEVDVSDDPFDCKRIDVSRIPCLITLNKIGHHHVVDATMEEEMCTLARLVLGVMEDGTITMIKKDGSGSLDLQSISEMTKTGVLLGKHMNTQLMKILKEEQQTKNIKQTTGFLR